MKRKSKYAVITATCVAVFLAAIAGWGTLKVVAWVKDLPNRIVVDADGIGQAFGDAVTLGYHEGLAGDDADVQIEIMNGFLTMANNDDEAASWVRSEFSDDLTSLAESSNPEIAKLANELMKLVAEPPASVEQESI